jgi:hypothetical protein
MKARGMGERVGMVHAMSAVTGSRPLLLIQIGSVSSRHILTFRLRLTISTVAGPLDMSSPCPCAT